MFEGCFGEDVGFFFFREVGVCEVLEVYGKEELRIGSCEVVVGVFVGGVKLGREYYWWV